jgi:Ca2+-binding RTX toxin-like protein
MSIRLIRTEALEARCLLSATLLTEISFATLGADGTLSVVGTAGDNEIDITSNGTQVQVSRDGMMFSFDASQVIRLDVNGFAGDDRITNNTNIDATLTGAGGNDTLASGTADDVLEGDEGNDTVTYASRIAPITARILLAQDTGNTYGGGGQDGEADSFVSVETIVGGSGDDNLTVIDDNGHWGDALAGATFELDGAGGDDSFFTVATESTIIADGGAGNDHFSFRGINNVLFGRDGNDTFTNDMSDDDAYAVIDAGSGVDTETFGSVPGVTISMGAGLENLDVANCNAIGNGLSNHITVTAGDGPLTVHGGGGNDTIESIDFVTALYGDGGNDTLTSVSKDPNVDKWDTLNVVSGNDVLIGNRGNDFLSGGSGRDTLDGGLGADQMYGGSNSDTVDYSKRTENITVTLDNLANDGAAGEHDNVHSDIETIIGGGGADRLMGNFANNMPKGNGGNDTLYGGDGNDTLCGNSGKDHLYGQGGRDMLEGKGGSKDTLDGGSARDYATRDHTRTIADVVLHVEKFM